MVWILVSACFVLMAVAALRARTTQARLTWLIGIVALATLIAATRLGARALVGGGLLGLWTLGRALLAKRREAAGPAPGADPRASMSREEALRVLGLAEGATAAQIAAAHRSLIKKLHPDQGGSGFLAQQVNEAKKVLESR